ncbi:hypothetical protein SS37A_39960 (plasmid) [Methylocystis iwaonis]|uniref:Uncharacterized protein n=1 Tax=Methylocystis iwaonis TaxID=2885079 RepID=A0ABM8EF62_9HYPH|nr:hypothetical protein SS37A_39960 [Methylocystis iwaonis]
MSRGAFLTIIAAMITGAIGFGIGVYAVPLEEIVQFRALVNAGIAAIFTTNHPANDDTTVEHPTAPSKASTEFDSPERDRSAASSSCDPHNTNCVGGSPTKGPMPDEVPSRDEATQNRPTNESGGALQAPTPTNEPARVPSSSPNSGSEKAHVEPGAHLKPRAKKAGVKNSTPRL